MSEHRPRPQSLRPFTPKQRYMLWGLIAFGGILGVMGWMNTISQIRFSGEGIIPEPVEEQVVKTIQGAGAMNEAVQEKTSLFTEAIELLRNSYLEEKAHIEQELETPVTE